MMKRTLTLLLTFTLLFALVSCGDKTPAPEPDREYDAAEVIAAARALIPPSADLNEIFWGAGIAASEAEGAFTSGGATEADPDALDRFDVHSLDGLREKTRLVYSAGVMQMIESTILSPVYDGETIVGHSRYFTAKEVVHGDGEAPTHFMVAKRANVLLHGVVTYDLDTLTVTRVRGQKVYVSLSATVTEGEDSLTDTLEIPLVEEANGWRLDAPTYLVYYKK